MLYTDFLLVILSLLFGFYFISAAVEYAYSFELLTGRQDSRQLLSPVIAGLQLFWTVTFGVLVLVYHGEARFISRGLAYILAAVVLAILLRSLAATAVYYLSARSLRLWLLRTFALCTLLTPLLFAVFGTYFLAGDFFWRSGIGVVLMVAAVTGLTALGLSLLELKGSTRRQLPGRLAFVLWLMLLGCVLPLASLHLGGTLSPMPLLVLVLAVGLCLGLMLLSFMRKKSIMVWPMASVLALITPLLLAWADRPYLVSGQATLEQASSSCNHGFAAASSIILALGAAWLVSGFLSAGFRRPPFALPKNKKPAAKNS